MRPARKRECLSRRLHRRPRRCRSPNCYPRRSSRSRSPRSAASGRAAPAGVAAGSAAGAAAGAAAEGIAPTPDPAVLDSLDPDPPRGA
jgi:hypothetical protein